MIGGSATGKLVVLFGSARLRWFGYQTLMRDPAYMIVVCAADAGEAFLLAFNFMTSIQPYGIICLQPTGQGGLGDGLGRWL